MKNFGTTFSMPEERVKIFLQKARRYIEENNREGYEYCIEKVLEITNYGVPEDFMLREVVFAFAHDVRKLRTAFKRYAIGLFEKGKFDRMLRFLTMANMSFSLFSQNDKERDIVFSDPEILFLIRLSAKLHPISSQIKRRRTELSRSPDRKIKLAFLFSDDIFYLNSIRLLKQIAKHIDRERFEIRCFCTITQSEIRGNEEFAGKLREIRSAGIEVSFPPDRLGWIQRCFFIANEMLNMKTDVLVTFHPSRFAELMFIIYLKPARATLAIPICETPKDPEIDAVFMFEKRSLSECTKLYPVEYYAQDISQTLEGYQKGYSKAELGIPDDKVVLISAAREAKFSREFVGTVAKILRKNPEAFFILMGKEHINFNLWFPEDLRDRVKVIRFSPLVEFGRVLRACDVFLDTFPATSASSLMESAYFGIPPVTFKDSEKPGKLEQHTPIFATFDKDDVFPKVDFGDTERYIELATKFIKDPEYRKRMGELASQIAKKYFSPEKFVRELEKCILNLI